MTEENYDDYEYTYEEGIDDETYCTYHRFDFYDYENSQPYLVIFRSSGLIPSLRCPFAHWYTVNFYSTGIGSVFEFLLLLAILFSMTKKNSQLRSYYYLQTSIIIFVDMIRFFIIADYRFSPSYFFSRGFANIIRNIHIVYGFFMSLFVPFCQLFLTVNRLTALMIPLKHAKVNYKFL